MFDLFNKKKLRAITIHNQDLLQRTIDAENTIAMTCKVLKIPLDSSGGKIRDAIQDLKTNKSIKCEPGEIP